MVGNVHSEERRGTILTNLKKGNSHGSDQSGEEKMPLRDPSTWSEFTWWLALGMSFAGGFVNWYSRIKQGHARVFNIIELVGEVFTSGFVGLGIFMFLAGIDQPVGICAASAGVGGHMSTRLLFTVERIAEDWLKKAATKPVTNSKEEKK